MNKYLVIHNFDHPLSLFDLDNISFTLENNSNTDASWVKSWLKFNSNSEVTAMYCVWDSKNITYVKQALNSSKFNFPITEISRMAEMSGKEDI